MEPESSNNEKFLEFWVLFITWLLILLSATFYWIPQVNYSTFDYFMWWLIIILPIIISLVDSVLSYFLLKELTLYENYRYFVSLLLLPAILLYIPFYAKGIILINEPIMVLIAIAVYSLIWIALMMIFRIIFISIIERIILIFIGIFMDLKRTSDFDLKQNILVYKKPDDLDDESVYQLIINQIIEPLEAIWVSNDFTSGILEFEDDIYRMLIVVYKGNVAILAFKKYFRDLSVDEKCKNISKSVSYVSENILNFEKVDGIGANEIINHADSVLLEYSSKNKFIQSIIINLYRSVLIIPGLIETLVSKLLKPIVVWFSKLLKPIITLFSKLSKLIKTLFLKLSKPITTKLMLFIFLCIIYVLFPKIIDNNATFLLLLLTLYIAIKA